MQHNKNTEYLMYLAKQYIKRNLHGILFFGVQYNTIKKLTGYLMYLAIQNNKAQSIFLWVWMCKTINKRTGYLMCFDEQYNKKSHRITFGFIGSVIQYKSS